ncbi:O-methyltransferase [Homoserinimonas sp. OAct 916]|uniref:O-methyltransferase n=1 Tax=Homoserinimonas sp. OAct 916 TaxID=2211450 RepID=UPI000DBE3860|nr:O-methyltransferase [Homoserinimonas sp. OAct 916]
MSDNDANWKFTEDLVIESEILAEARALSRELGIDTISPATGAQCAVVAAVSGARQIIEVGTGVGVSGLCLLAGAPGAHLTSIDTEVDHQQHARTHFTQAQVSANRVRLITGDAGDVLPRMNENSYDVVFVDADPLSVIEYVEHGLRLARPRGIVLVPHVLWRGRVANPAQRDEIATGFRTLLREISTSSAVVSAVSPVGDGLLQIIKLGD